MYTPRPVPARNPVRGLVIASAILGHAMLICASAHAQSVRAAPFATGLDSPVSVVSPPGDPSRLFVLGRFGHIGIYDTATGMPRPRPFIDLYPLVCCFGNASMVGLAFDPQYASNGYFYVHYQGLPTESVVMRYRVTNDPDIADPASAAIVLRLPRDDFGHIGGAINFSPRDGYLYIPTGDSGNGVFADPQNASQNTMSLMGKVLRIDPGADDFPADPDRNYRIPPTNPFLGVPNVRPEIWSVGLRNPYQSAFDPSTGDFWIADVGQDQREEVDVRPANSAGAENYGWRCREGNICSGYGGCDCQATTFIDPLYSYDHNDGCSISGGRVYRGSAIPSLDGWFVFSDYCSGFVRAVRRTTAGVELLDLTAQVAPASGFHEVTSVSQDGFGELYITDFGTTQGGNVYKLVPVSFCVADVDDGTGTGTRDGGVGIEDLLYYITLYAVGAPAADVDDGSGTGTRDGGVSIDDLLYYLYRYDAGC